MRKHTFRFNGKVVDWFLIVGVVVIIVLSVLIYNKVNNESYVVTGNKGNPGCDTLQQAKCEQTFYETGVCPKDCVECDDYQGSGCVPSNCAKSACM